MPGRQGSSCAPDAARQVARRGDPAGKCSPGRRPDIISSPATRKRQPGGADPVALRPGWVARRGGPAGRGSSLCARLWSGRRRSPQNSSARGPAGWLEGATRRGNAVRDVGPALSLRPRPREGGSAKAARRRRPGGVYPVALRFGRRVSNYVPVCGPAGVRARRQPPDLTPSAAARQGAHGRGPWGGLLGTLPRKKRTAVAHGADPSERSPAKIARRAWLLPSPSLSLRPERAGPLRPPLNLHTP